MSNFNSDLNNLFSNWQNQQKYNKYTKASAKDKKDMSLWSDIDLNKDGKITSADKIKMTNEATTLKKNKNLFDVNGDGIFNQTDINLFTKADVNGDEEITQDELNFVSAYKKELINAFTKQKADFEIDGKKYVQGKPATGVYDGKYYRNGVLSDGTASGKKYVKGEPANDTIAGILYKNGIAFTGLHTDNKYYKNGKVFTGTITDKETNTTTNYKAGVLQYKITVPPNSGIKVTNNKITFSKGTTITMKAGFTFDATQTPAVLHYNEGNKTDSKNNCSIFIYPDGRIESLAFGMLNGKVTTDLTALLKFANVKIPNNSKSPTDIIIKPGQETDKPIRQNLPKLVGNTIEFANGTRLTLEENETATINYDGTVTVNNTGKVGIDITKTYDIEGHFLGEKDIYSNGNKLYFDSNHNISYIEKYVEGNKIVYDDECKYLSEGLKSILFSLQASISDEILSDIEIIKNAEKAGVKGSEEYNASIKSQMIKTESNMENVVGEVVEKSDGLYVNDGEKLVKLGISAETYLNLFPPVERYDAHQGSIGDCYFVSSILTDGMTNPNTFARILNMFSEDSNGNLTITLNQGGPITFPNSELFVLDGMVGNENIGLLTQVRGAKGLQFIEQAFAISKFSNDSYKAIDEIDIDEAINHISQGWLQSRAMNFIFGGNATNDSINPSYNSHFDNSIFNNMSNTEIQTHTEQMKTLLDTKIKMETYYSQLKSMGVDPNKVEALSEWYALEHNGGNIWQDAIQNGSINTDFIRQMEQESGNYFSGGDESLITEIANYLNNENYDIAQLINTHTELETLFYSYMHSELSPLSLFSETIQALDTSSIEKVIQDINNYGLSESFNKAYVYINEYLDNRINFFAESVNKGEILLGADSRDNMHDDEFSIIEQHAYTIKNINTEKRTISIIDPHNSGAIITMTYEQFSTYFNRFEWSNISELPPMYSHYEDPGNNFI